MARARNIKPSFFTNEQVSDNCPLGRLLFIGLWTMADYKGDLEWKEKTLKIQLLPWDECSLRELAINLDKSGLIRFYSDGNKIYINIPNFEKHQNPHKNERDKGSDIPHYSDAMRQAIDFKGLTINHDLSGLKRNSSTSDRADSLLLNPDSLILNPEPVTPESQQVATPQAAAGLFENPDNSTPDNKKPPKPKAAEKFKPESLASTMPNELGKWWIMWIEYRRARKLSTKEPTWRLQASNLEEWGKAGLDPCQAIKASIENGWQGLFEPKPKNTGMSNGYQPRPANHIDDNNTDWINGIDPRVFDRARAGGTAAQQGSAGSEGHMPRVEGCDNQPGGLRLDAPAVAHRDAGKQDFD
jgi:hypothetical protein